MLVRPVSPEHAKTLPRTVCACRLLFASRFLHDIAIDLIAEAIPDQRRGPGAAAPRLPV